MARKSLKIHKKGKTVPDIALPYDIPAPGNEGNELDKDKTGDGRERADQYDGDRCRENAFCEIVHCSKHKYMRQIHAIAQSGKRCDRLRLP